MADEAPEGGPRSGLQGSFVMQKTGPLPNWAWMAIGLGIALAYAAWQKSKRDKEEAEKGPTKGFDYPEWVKAPTFAFVDADTTVNTQNAYPPGGGRSPRPGPGPAPDPTPAPDGAYVSVVKWTRKNAPWNSTVAGIAEKMWGNGNLWQSIWYAPQNASLREQREDPDEIQPGDKLWVPTAAPGQGADQQHGHPNQHGNGQNGNGHSGGGRNRRQGSRGQQ